MRSNNVKDFSTIYKKFAGKWVALDSDEEKVLGSSKNAEDAVEKAKKKGENTPILFKVPKPSISWVGSL